jgi:hypothetical protein
VLVLLLILACSAGWARHLIYELRETGCLWDLRARVAVETPEVLAAEPRWRRVLLVVLTAWEIGMLALMMLQIAACALGMVGIGPWAPGRGLLWTK